MLTPKQIARHAPEISGDNLFINGGFDIWQRATSQTATGCGSADRWRFNVVGTTQSVSRQAADGSEPFKAKYYVRDVVTSSAGSANNALLEYRWELLQETAGKTITLSFYAKADASKNIACEMVQYFGSGGSASVFSIDVTTVALTTGWVRHKVTFDMPSISGKTIGSGNVWFGLALWLDAGSSFDARTNSLGQQSGTFEFANFKLEYGSEATPFVQRPFAQELSECQRYYVGSITTNPHHQPGAIGPAITADRVSAGTQFPVTMRAIPTVVIYPSPTGGTAGTVTEYNGATEKGESFGANTKAYGGFNWISGAGGALTIGNFHRYYYTADAEL